MLIDFRRVRRFATLMGAMLAASTVVSCSGGDAPSPPTMPNLSAPSPKQTATSAPLRDERQAVVSAYTQFWPRSLHIDQEPEQIWRRALAAVAAEPQLSTTLDAVHRQKATGVTTYGDVTVRISSVDVSGATAHVVDCQDASDLGQADARTGAKKTVGVARMPVHAVLTRDEADGSWKVSRTEFPGGEC
ncbi:hypothetical protein [Amycolatopsis ultiminotia]